MKLAEIQKVLETSGNTPWRGLVLLGLYTGQRLGDCARLTWQQVDLPKRTVSFVTQKTGKRLEMSLAEPLANYLSSLPSVDDPKAFVFPAFAAMVEKRVGMLPRPKKSVGTGKGRTGKRTVNAVTFHSLRHSFTTMLKATGASNAMAQGTIQAPPWPPNKELLFLCPGRAIGKSMTPFRATGRVYLLSP